MSGIHEEGISAEEYFHYRRKQAPSRYVRRACRGLLSGDRELSVLEVGCGAGFALKQMAVSTKEGVRITGCDCDPELLRFAAEVNGGARDRISIVCNGNDSLPFSSGVFDLVYSEATLHHFDDARGMIAEMWRVLKPGGNLVIADLNPESSLAAAYALYAETMARLGIASKSGIALARSIRDSLSEKKATGLFAELGICCRTSRSRGSVCYEACKPPLTA